MCVCVCVCECVGVSVGGWVGGCGVCCILYLYMYVHFYLLILHNYKKRLKHSDRILHVQHVVQYLLIQVHVQGHD